MTNGFFQKAFIAYFTGSLVLLLGFQLVRLSHYREAYFHVCDLVNERFFEKTSQLSLWHEDCLSQPSLMWVFKNQEEWISHIRHQLYKMGVSHLEIYTPPEEQRMWRGQDVDTGLRVRNIQDRFVVYKIVPKSSAEAQDVKVGDEIISIHGKPIRSIHEIEKRGGQYVIRRMKVGEMTKLIQPQSLQIDDQPLLVPAGERVGLLTISSFRSEYFQEKSWKDQAKKLNQFKNGLIIDLRGNLGGNFVAMLRALSPFLCEPVTIGHLVQPRKPPGEAALFPDRLDDDLQIRLLEQVSQVELVTFPNYGCYRGPVAILIDQHTSSVSEIFTQAMIEAGRARVIGETSAGNVVLAIWYELHHWGKGHSLSIPEAVYVGQAGETLEGKGVWPDISATYKLEDALMGVDSYIATAKDVLLGRKAD